jgi:hypothetical protein
VDPDPAILVINLQYANKKLIKKKFSCLSLFESTVHIHHFSKMKGPKKSQNSRNQGFPYYFCLLIEGSGRPKKHADPVDPDSDLENWQMPFETCHFVCPEPCLGFVILLGTVLQNPSNKKIKFVI